MKSTLGGARTWGPSLAAAWSVAVLAAGCGAGPSVAPATTVPSRPLTLAQAVQLSSTLYEDHRLGGAVVDVAVPYTATVTVAIHGTVDFRAHAGHLEVVTDPGGSTPVVQAVDFTASAVYEAEPGAAGTPTQWTQRPPDPTDRPLDRVVQLLVALASAQRDNPLLVRQSQARWVGARPDGGVLVDVYRYSPTITYWIGRADGLLRRFVAVVEGIAGPVTVDLSAWGPHPSPPPPTGAIGAAPPTAGD